MKHIYIMSGPPACGKSSWVRECIERDGGIHISRDTIRFSMITEEDDEITEKNVNSLIFDFDRILFWILLKDENFFN